MATARKVPPVDVRFELNLTRGEADTLLNLLRANRFHENSTDSVHIYSITQALSRAE